MRILGNLLMAVAAVVLSFGAATAQDKNAEAILKKVQKKYEAYNTMSVDFTQEIANAESDLNQKINGKLYLKGDKFRLEIADQIMISDNQNFWIYFEPEQEVIIDRVSDQEMFKPSDIFKLYDKDFDYKLLPEKARRGNQQFHVIQFQPKAGKARDEAFFHTIKLYVDVNDNSIAQAVIKDKNNTLMTYKINSLTPNPNLGNDYFTWDKSKYPKVTVTDKRN